ncbi:MAG: isochorismatase family cysteine hydrolase [Veillonella sp.]|nr:isochorismatase family cysteine hydrolase [Veillonella sp.]
MQKVLVVIDMQNDFVDGALGSTQAQMIVDNVRKKIESFDGPIIFTRDTHGIDYLERQEGKMLPVPHCVKNTEGWHIVPGLIEAADKPNFGSLELLSRLEGMNSVNPIESITLVGLCTDICVVSNAIILKAGLPEIPVYVDSSCCAGVTEESHQAALTTMKMCQCIVE